MEEFGNANLTMSNMTFISNTIDPITDSSALITCTLAGAAFAVISDVTFENNVGTPINVDFQQANSYSTHLTVSGIFLFIRNTGINGGACSFYQVPIYIQTNSTVNMTFMNNSAVYGGALYMSESTFDFDTNNVVLQFQNNKAQTAGDFIYFATSNVNIDMLSNWLKNFSELSSAATEITVLANEENIGCHGIPVKK